MTLYDADRCPYCARVRLVLAEKGVPHETVVVDLDDRPPGSTRRTRPAGCPVLEEDAFLLPESDVICEYLEERYPEPPLLPADPAERALARLAIFRFDDRLGDDYYALRRGEDGAARPARRAARRPRRGARGAAVPHRPRVRARRRRVPAVGAAGARAARRLARAVPGALGLARALPRAAVGRGRARARRRAVRRRPPPRAPARRADVGAVEARRPGSTAAGSTMDAVGALDPRRGRRRARRSSAPRWAATARSRRRGSRPSACAGSRSSARAPRPTRPSGARAARRRSRRSAAAARPALWEDDAPEALPGGRRRGRRRAGARARARAAARRPRRRGRGDPRPRRPRPASGSRSTCRR